MLARGFPSEKTAFVEALNFDAKAYGRTNSGSSLLFPVTAGVPQGCPASGSKYTIASDPPLRALQRDIGAEGKLAACADDTAAALRTACCMRSLVGTFSTIRKASGLGLKPSKCNIIPITDKSRNELARFRRWMQREIPK